MKFTREEAYRAGLGPANKNLTSERRKHNLSADKPHRRRKNARSPLRAANLVQRMFGG